MSDLPQSAGVTTAECYIPACSGCPDPFDDYTPHFSTEKEARDFMADSDWRVLPDRALCERCAAKSDCAERNAHAWGEWRDRVDRRGWPAQRYRACMDCHEMEHDPPQPDRGAVSG
jgi:hypothetical protein